MSTFDAAVKVVLVHEGGWVSDPADLGGETNFGISTKIIKEAGITPEFLGLDPATAFTAGWLKPMSVDAASKVYKQLFWDKYGYGPINDQTVATKIFDCGVNCGPVRAHGMAQRAATACGWPCNDDGILGPMSIKQINACDPHAFITAMTNQMTFYYKSIVISRPMNAKFLPNWLSRARWGM